MKNTLKTIVAVLGLSLALTACGSKPAETTETTDSVATEVVVDSAAQTVVDSAATTTVDSAAVAK